MHEWRGRMAAATLLYLWAVLPAFAATGADAGYAQPLRPQYHFSPKRHWMNDPNGLVYYEGEYHLFFQYNPQGEVWGHMSWGHAVSSDLVHWRELPVAIPEDDRYMIFSGSIVVDAAKTQRLFTQRRPGAGGDLHRQQPGAGGVQSQQLAYSTDRGRTWTKYPGNPVLDLGAGTSVIPRCSGTRQAVPGSWPQCSRTSTRSRCFPRLTCGTGSIAPFGPAGAADGAG